MMKKKNKVEIYYVKKRAKSAPYDLDFVPAYDPEKRLAELISGSEPRNESEKRMVKDIQDIIKKGGIVDIPGM